MSLLAKDIKRRLGQSRRGTKAPPKTLSVALPDGQTICEKKSVDTFIKTFRYMGLEKCVEIEDVICRGYPVASTTRNKNINRNQRNIKEVEGYFIGTNSSTDAKAKQLRAYAQKLGIDLQVEVTD